MLFRSGPIHRHTHRVFLPDLSRINHFVVRHRRGLLALFLLAFLPALYGQSHAEVYYKLDEALPRDMPSIVATNKLRDEFGMASTHFIVMRDGLPRNEMEALLAELEAVDGIEGVAAYDKLVSNAIPEFFLPQDLVKLCKRDGLQIVMLSSAYETDRKSVV